MGIYLNGKRSTRKIVELSCVIIGLPCHLTQLFLLFLFIDTGSEWILDAGGINSFWNTINDTYYVMKC